MNTKRYEELKEFVFSLSNDELYSLFEIQIDEMNYRKMEHKPIDDS